MSLAPARRQGDCSALCKAGCQHCSLSAAEQSLRQARPAHRLFNAFWQAKSKEMLLYKLAVAPGNLELQHLCELPSATARR